MKSRYSIFSLGGEEKQSKKTNNNNKHDRRKGSNYANASQSGATPALALGPDK